MGKPDCVVLNFLFRLNPCFSVNLNKQVIISCAISGLNLARMLGDKFLKQQEARFSSEPYISQVVKIHQASRAVAVLAR